MASFTSLPFELKTMITKALIDAIFEDFHQDLDSYRRKHRPARRAIRGFRKCFPGMHDVGYAYTEKWCTELRKEYKVGWLDVIGYALLCGLSDEFLRGLRQGSSQIGNRATP